MDLQGEVRLKEGDRSGKADHATFVRATQTALLTGKALARDAIAETRAARITFVQTNGEIRAEGGVSVDGVFDKWEWSATCRGTHEHFGGRDAGEFRRQGEPVHGTCALVAGDSVMEADSIELLREAKVLNAIGSVRAVFPQRWAHCERKRGRPGGAEEAAVVACNGGDADIPRRR